MKKNLQLPVLGIDIGSVSVSAVLMGRDKFVLGHGYAAHKGDLAAGLKQALKTISPNGKILVSITASSPPRVHHDAEYDNQVAVIRSAKQLFPKVGAILTIGAEKFSLALFNETGLYTGSKNNSACAAGTGSFLDQQAARLGLINSQELSLKAVKNRRPIPNIATRCAVFAKTDLIHAQQEGFSIPQISDGLCRGVAKNVYNTLFTNKTPRSPILLCGGVSQNNSVKKHLEALIKAPLTCDGFSHLYGAMGAALCLMDDLENKRITTASGINYTSIQDLLIKTDRRKKACYPKLFLTLSQYPDFESHKHFIENGVENDIYIDPGSMDSKECYLGLDVGSTSTKAVIMTKNETVVAGFYTRTASRPVEAVQSIFKTADTFIRKHNIKMEILGCGTTGSGRKLSGGIIGADLVLDEITAHARAARQLDPTVDTIIEIGGQDAKFTTMKNGVVTSSTMNSVCAAGTGSFIEEQAEKLAAPLNELSVRTRNVKAPIASDRCTVFMERDINNFLTDGYEVNEVLASALHSVRDNYLTKVASVGKIGKTVLFQGATAKNPSLVAAFEQKLEKPIHVSKYCHLTGALGVALILKDRSVKQSCFKGFDLWEFTIPVRQEECSFCTNNCKLTIADMDQETVAFGFLCGRDYDTDHFVAKKRHYNLIKARKKTEIFPKKKSLTTNKIIGIPAALHLVEDLGFWKVFFDDIGIETITSEGLKDPVSKGRSLSTAEFCTPMTSIWGHAAHLLEKADYLFLPFYFENANKKKNTRRQFCYYTQYLPSLIGGSDALDTTRVISPVVRYLYSGLYTKFELYKALKPVTKGAISFFEISLAYDRAWQWKKDTKKKLEQLYEDQRKNSLDVDVLLLGRPYTILSKSLNSRIPDLFSNMGINLFFQDMLNSDNHNIDAINPLLEEVHWQHAAAILKSTLIAATTDNLYPVYVTSFKCSPDAFGVQYFKQIMEAHDKPYLILELDEHDSNVGYETRIEAAVAAFRNHKQYRTKPKKVRLGHLNPKLCSKLSGKTVVFPNWDPITGELLAATLRGEGFKSVLMKETTETIQGSLKSNTGQCLPLNAIANGFCHTMTTLKLNPKKSVLWLSQSDISCNIKLYPHHIKTILGQLSPGMETAGVFRGGLFFNDLSITASVNAYFAYMFGGLIRSIGCRIRPYEVLKGQTDHVIEKSVTLLSKAFEQKTSKENALMDVIALFGRIPVNRVKRPKVAIFGDFYVRDNAIMNQDLIHFIEQNGGEVITTPYYRFAQMIADSYFKKWFNEGKYLHLLSNKALQLTMRQMEKKYYRLFKPLLDEPEIAYTDSFETILKGFGLLPEHTGESMDNILKIHYITKEHPDISLFVQTSPSFCCPGLVTEAMAGIIEKKTGTPMVSITYDASEGSRNEALIPYLHFNRDNRVTADVKQSIQR